MKKFTTLLVALMLTVGVFAQKFEPAKISSTDFSKVKIHVGADFALQFQSIDNSADGVELMPLGSALNLPTANLNISADLAPGMRVYLRTYLSSRHHNDSWVKGGYLQMDALPFLKSDFIDNLMQYVTIKIGVDELNYGDGHFRRSDNAAVMNNPFVGNFIMDAFTTAPMVEVTYRRNGWIAMLGTSDGSLDPSVVTMNDDSTFNKVNTASELAVYAKFGFDKQFKKDLRWRFTVSPFYHNHSRKGTLYKGDRTGARYYQVMVPASDYDDDISDNHLNGRWGPTYYEHLAAGMVNTFVKYNDFEFFGLLEHAGGQTLSGNNFAFNQYSVEGLYRFGGTKQFYGTARYNRVANDGAQSVNRYQIAAGWFLTKNVMTKLEYVHQNYNNFEATYGGDAQFKGVMFEAAISF